MTYRSIFAACLAALGAATPLVAQAPIRVDTAVAVHMRDGVVLRADLYRPPGDGRFPVLVHRTPYSRTESPPVAELAVSASVPDFDLWVQLYDVAPDGTAWNLSTPGTALQRASYRDGGPERRLVKPDETVRLRMDHLVTANRFLAGHRLRLVVTPAFAPLFSVNPQTGAQEFESDSVRVGDIRIGHAAGRSSWIVLPVVPLGNR